MDRMHSAQAAVLAVAILVAGRVAARDVYVAPNGTSQGDGTQASPIDLATALTSSEDVHPGDTVWLAGGTYKGPFTKPPRPAGTPGKPIIYRATAGQRVTLTADPATPVVLENRASHVWFWGLEVTLGDKLPRTGGYGVNLKGGECTKLINLIVHDNPKGQGIGGWNVGSDHEYYGCLVYRNGLGGKRLAHGIYTQNTKSHTTKKIRDCLFFDNFGFGVHCYGEAPALAKYLFEGVVAFGNGMPMGNEGPVVNFLVGGKKNPTDDITVRNCFTFFPQKGGAKRGADFGYRADNNGSLTVERCMFVGGADAIQIKKWQRVTFRRNFCYTTRGHALALVSPSAGLDRKACSFDNNVYFGVAKASFVQFDDKQAKSLYAWRRGTGWDKHSRLLNRKPTRPMLFLRPNEYEPDRAHLIVYNWPERRTVTVDLGRLWDIKKGQRYKLVNVEDIWAKPDARGIFTGRPIRLRLSGAYAPAFACYLVTRSGPDHPKAVVDADQPA